MADAAVEAARERARARWHKAIDAALDEVRARHRSRLGAVVQEARIQNASIFARRTNTAPFAKLCATGLPFDETNKEIKRLVQQQATLVPYGTELLARLAEPSFSNGHNERAQSMQFVMILGTLYPLVRAHKLSGQQTIQYGRALLTIVRNEYSYNVSPNQLATASSASAGSVTTVAAFRLAMQLLETFLDDLAVIQYRDDQQAPSVTELGRNSIFEAAAFVIRQMALQDQQKTSDKDKPEPYIQQLNEKLRGWSRQFKFRYYLSVAAIFPMTTTLRTREVLRKAVLQEFEDHPVEVVEEMQRLMESVPKRLAAGVPQIPQILTRGLFASPWLRGHLIKHLQALPYAPSDGDIAAVFRFLLSTLVAIAYPDPHSTQGGAKAEKKTVSQFLHVQEEQTAQLLPTTLEALRFFQLKYEGSFAEACHAFIVSEPFKHAAAVYDLLCTETHPELTIKFVQTTLPDFIDRAAASPRAMTLDEARLRKALRFVYRVYPKEFAAVLIAASHSKIGQVTTHVGRLALLSEFFRPDELFFPESSPELQPSLAKLGLDARKPALLMQLLEGTYTGAMLILTELVTGLQRWKPVVERDLATKAESVSVARLRQNVEAIEWWILVHIQAQLKRGIGAGESDQAIVLILQLLYVQFFQEARAIGGGTMPARLEGWTNVLFDWALRQYTSAEMDRFVKNEGTRDYLSLYRQALAPSFHAHRRTPAGNEPESPFMLHFRVREEALDDLFSVPPAAQAFRALLHIFWRTPSTAAQSKLAPRLRGVWELLDTLPYSITYRNASLVFQMLADMKENEHLARTIVCEGLYHADPAVRCKTLEKLSFFFDLRFHYGSDDKFFRPPGSFLPFTASATGREDFRMEEPEWVRRVKMAAAARGTSVMQADERERKMEQERERAQRLQTPVLRVPIQAIATDEASERARAYYASVLPFAVQPMVDLLDDATPMVAVRVRQLLRRMIAEEPSLALRSFLTDLGKIVTHLSTRYTTAQAAEAGAKQVIKATTPALSRLLRLVMMEPRQSVAFAHILFNHLLGLLKTVTSLSPAMVAYTQTQILPLVASCMASMRDVKLRDMRRDRIDMYAITNGAFWYTHPSRKDNKTVELSGLAFPRGWADMPPASTFPLSFEGWTATGAFAFNMLEMRLQQSLFMVAFAKSCAAELGALKHVLSQSGQLTERIAHEDPLADVDAAKLGGMRDAMEPLQLQVKRAWLAFIDAMCRQFGEDNNFLQVNDLDELIRTVNAVAERYPRDTEIVRQALVFYVTLAVHFHTWCDSQGYLRFMAAFVRLYHHAKREDIEDVVDGAEYAYARFVALHRDNFMLQCIQANVPQLVDGDDALVNSFFSLVASVQLTDDESGGSGGVGVGGGVAFPPSSGTSGSSAPATGAVSPSARRAADSSFLFRSAASSMAIGSATADVETMTLKGSTVLQMKQLSERRDRLGVYLDAPSVAVSDTVAPRDLGEDAVKINEYGVSFLIRVILPVVALEPSSARAVTLMRLWRILLPRMMAFFREKEEKSLKDVLFLAVRVLVQRVIAQLLRKQALVTAQTDVGISLTRFINRGQQQQHTELLRETVQFLQLYMSLAGAVSSEDAQVIGRILKSSARLEIFGDSTNLDWLEGFLGMSFSSNDADSARQLVGSISTQLARVLRHLVKANMDSSGLLRGLTDLIRSHPTNQDLHADISKHFLEFAFRTLLLEAPKEAAHAEATAPSCVGFIQALLEYSDVDVEIFSLIRRPDTNRRLVVGRLLLPLARQLSRSVPGRRDFSISSWAQIVDLTCQWLDQAEATSAARDEAWAPYYSALHTLLFIALLRAPPCHQPAMRLLRVTASMRASLAPLAWAHASGKQAPRLTASAPQGSTTMLRPRVGSGQPAAPPLSPGELEDATRWRVLGFIAAQRGQLASLMRPHLALLLSCIPADAVSESRRAILEDARRLVRGAPRKTDAAELLRELNEEAAAAAARLSDFGKAH